MESTRINRRNCRSVRKLSSGTLDRESWKSEEWTRERWQFILEMYGNVHSSEIYTGGRDQWSPPKCVDCEMIHFHSALRNPFGWIKQNPCLDVVKQILNRFATESVQLCQPKIRLVNISKISWSVFRQGLCSTRMDFAGRCMIDGLRPIKGFTAEVVVTGHPVFRLQSHTHWDAYLIMCATLRQLDFVNCIISSDISRP